MVLANFSCDIRTAYRGIAPGTVRHVDELIQEECQDQLPLGSSYYTADARTYFIKDNSPYLALTRVSGDLCLNRLVDFLGCEEFYRPSQDEVQPLLQHPSTGIFDLTKLRFSGADSEDTKREVVLHIPRTGYRESLNPEELRIAEYVCGSSEGLAEWMTKGEKKDPKFSGFGIHVFQPRFVLEMAGRGPFMQLSILDVPDLSGTLSGDIYFRGEPLSR